MRALLAVLLAAPGLTGPAGCAHAPPCDGVSCAPACPRDSAIDRAGRCACAEGDVPLLGACVPLPVGEAFCGPAARMVSDGAGGGCVFRECGAGQSLDMATGACAPRGPRPRGGATGCPAPAVPLLEAGQEACVAPEAACPRGTRPGASGPEGQTARTCERPLACPPGSLADGSTCRSVVMAGGRTGDRVDVGAWAALALGIHGGPGTAALCRPLAQRPGLFERVPGPPAVPVDGGALPAALALRVAVTLRLPDQDVSRLHAEVRARDASGRPVSAAAQALASAAVDTALEALRGLGGEASAASVELEVTCAVGETSM